MAYYRTLTDSLGLIHHLPRRIHNAHKTTAAIHRSWAAYWRKTGNITLALANLHAAEAAEKEDKHAYNVIVAETGITAWDFVWRQQLKQEQRHSQAA